MSSAEREATEVVERHPGGQVICGVSSLSSKYHSDKEKLLAQKTERVARAAWGGSAGQEKKIRHAAKCPLVHSRAHKFQLLLGSFGSFFI